MTASDPLCALLTAWEAWDARPKDEHTAAALVDAQQAFVGFYGGTTTQLRRLMGSGRRMRQAPDVILDRYIHEVAP